MKSPKFSSKTQLNRNLINFAIVGKLTSSVILTL